MHVVREEVTKMKVGIVGATGYGGGELVRLLLKHSEISEIIMSSRSECDQELNSIHPHLRYSKSLLFEKKELNELAEETDLIFLATPSGFAMKNVTDEILKKAKVIDLSADFRLKEEVSYPLWYGMTHANTNLLAKAVYGLSEWNKEVIKNATLLANPGCYVTSSLLALLPFAKKGMIQDQVIIDAKSGVSGAGKGLQLGTHYPECNENLKAYKVGSHRHTPEIEEVMKQSHSDFEIQFTPHLIPMNRGILTTSYTKLTKDYEALSEDELRDILTECYSGNHFIRVLPKGIYPETKWVKGSNYCDINVVKDERTKSVILLSCIDNLVKGAAGQAVQNMNLMMGFSETLGLTGQPIHM